MFLKKSYALQALLILSGVVFFSSCEKEFNELGVDLIEDNNFDIRTQSFNVTAASIDLSAVRTDAMPLYQLSDYTDALFGKSQASYVTQLTLSQTSPVFGDLSKQAEIDSSFNENERVTEVILDLPFFSRANDTLSDNNAPIPYDIDSVFGDTDAPLQVTVREYTKYLRNLDPATNFQSLQEYYSNEDPVPFLSTVLFDGSYTLNFEELLFFENEDDPDTPDVDESQDVSSRFSPRIRLSLDPQFFQNKILDNEGEEVLTNQELFQDFLRGIYVALDHPTDDLKLLLNANEGNVVVKYDYDFRNSENNEIEVAKDSFLLNIGQGKSFNIYNEAPYPTSIQEEITAGEAAQRLYLKGESGVAATIDLSAGQGLEGFIQEAKENNWLINEANLYIYPDAQLAGNQGLPGRMFLYDFENNTTLFDYIFDPVGLVQDLPLSSYPFYDGILQDEDGEDPFYRFRITEHVKNIVNNDSTNVKLGLSLTANVNSATFVTAFDQMSEEIQVPQAANYYPFSVVLYGANLPAEEQGKRIRLELIYTEPKSISN
ncbi:DUF4270 domain-containing protein [Robertkochia marina]|uniref:DUF4270 domain-containing protein n=1 Tax=Robertkochia marina TaxID=1227945 RepID=A0A4S3M391_9FLAO|nr:DUF4270 domain-containing protein [Robertkochia marina]THD69533.1 DUF4270 domain-containing protein [Robertkochia marina]TRZ47208.1 DUF4270 domain-containing protein [Robertkochia marina]